MGVDILGFDNVPRFEIGLSLGGFILLGIYALATIASLLRSRHDFRELGLRRSPLLAILTLAAPLLMISRFLAALPIEINGSTRRQPRRFSASICAGAGFVL